MTGDVICGAMFVRIINGDFCGINHSLARCLQSSVANSPEVFERYFKAPHNYDLKGASQVYGVKHQVAQTESEFEELYAAALANNQTVVIEIKTQSS